MVPPRISRSDIFFTGGLKEVLAVAFASLRLLGAFTCSVVCSGITACLHLQTDECECEALESFQRRRSLVAGLAYFFVLALFWDGCHNWFSCFFDVFLMILVTHETGLFS